MTRDYSNLGEKFTSPVLGAMQPQNNNYFVRVGSNQKGPLPDGWQNYAQTEMTAFGPIGIIKDGPQAGRFEYLDPEIKAWRG